MSRRPTNATLAPLTLTHARLRARQGDVAQARNILQALLGREPDNEPARRLLEQLRGHADAGRRVPAVEEPAPREPATPDQLARRFRAALDATPAADPRVRRLERWLRRIAPDSS